METKTNPTMTRRRQRRPDLESTFDIPADLQHLISRVGQRLLRCAEKDASQASAVTAKVIGIADNALQELLQPSLTPAQQLHAISKVTGALKDISKPQLSAILTTTSGELYEWGRTLALEAVVPLLLDCRVRYLHRALMTLLRTLLPSPDASTQAVVRELYITHVLRRTDASTIASTICEREGSSGAAAAAGAAAAVYFPAVRDDAESSVSASRDAVLSFLNSVDGLTSTLMPMMPSVFKDTFMEVLPMLAACFQWVVVNATSHSRSQVGTSGKGRAAVASLASGLVGSEETVAAEEREGEEEERDGNVGADALEEENKGSSTGRSGEVWEAQQPAAVGATVFGEDLEHIRFCVRVVATYIHKYMDALTSAMVSGTAEDDVSRQLARLLQPTVVMLTSPIFPKDVLNAVGLLVASILTVRTCDAWLLSAVCVALRDVVAAAASPIAAATADTVVAATSPLSLAELFARADVALSVVCAAHPRVAAEAGNGAGAMALHDLFTAFTPNGCFALLKGILAHVSSPTRGDWLSFGVLLCPHSGGEDEAADGVVYSVILPAAKQFCNMVQEPETRFMAIQTVDSVVRHVSAVLSTAAAALRRSGQALGKDAGVCGPARDHLASLCVSTVPLQAMLAFSTQLIMALWDDGTQQMSGALYGTYNEILKISEALHQCGEEHHHAAVTSADRARAEVDTAVTLDQILDVQAERRGKYHALLGHLSMMPLESFLAVLQRHYRCESAVSDAVAAFSRTLLAGASNHKIGNVAGDVFAQLARALNSPSSSAALAKLNGSSRRETVAEVLSAGILRPLARAITERSYVTVSSNVSEAVNISHITAHFVAPLVKHDATFLQFILSAIVQSTPASEMAPARSGEAHKCERVEQGVVEVLSRARGVGVDITPYVAPGTTVLRVLEASTHSLNYDVRNSALCLCVLGTKKIQAVQPWQLQKVEEYLVLNMHLGGDSTARKGLLEMLRKWVRRLVESYTSKGGNTAAGDAASAVKATKKPRNEGTGGVVPQPSEPSADALELGTPAYRHAVAQHCVRVAEIFAQNIGVNLRASAGLAVERRVTAMMGYVVLVQSLRAVMQIEAEEADSPMANGGGGQSIRTLLHPCVVPALIATLSDGWSQARDSARDLLHLFCELVPADVFSEAGEVSGEAASSLALIERAHHDLLKAQTYRNAEGAVQRFLLFSTRSSESLARVRDHPEQELCRLDALLSAERGSVEEKCAAMSAMRGSSAYAYIQANPLHGSLSLCAELLGCAAVVERQLSLSAVKGDTAAVRGAVLGQACTNLLRCCCVVLRTCSSLVGTETVTGGGAAAALAGSEVVDCRGHVYDRSRPEAESVMRGVVNNTWLSMRVATSAIERILKVRAVQLLPFDEVRTAAYELVHALLLTKHNGVMRCVREALKALTSTLVRSRTPQFYQLPAELLSFLLGPEGVTSGDMARMLRRSQGLPHAILAVLEAEDTAVPYCLFPIAMRQLIRVARGDVPLTEGATSPFSNLGNTPDDVRRSQRSNALNVLKFIFEDKVFADRVVAHIEEAFSLATEGFHDASWYTRNSSLMLFSAVIHRFVGEHPSTGGSGVNTSLHDVAKRTPRGVAYAYAELTRGNGLVGDEAGGSAASPEVNVALFPVLQLLSMLSPDPPHLITKASHSEWDDTSRMSAAVMRCAASPSLMVRSASAVALCCLVPIASLASVIAQTKRGLLLSSCDAATQDAHSEGSEGHFARRTESGGGLNACHGALLQLLQFHAQYVGTLRRHYRQKRSSYATPAVAESVCHAICEAVLACRAVLVKACGVCPTVAAALFALLADLVYYGPQQRLTEEQQHTLRALCVASLEAYVLSNKGVLERGSVMEGASAVIVFTAAQNGAAVGAWTASEQRRVAEVLHFEAANLAIRSGEHNLISWIAAQLLHYADGSGALLNPARVACVLQVLADDVHCNLSPLVFQTLTEYFGTSDKATAARIGCLSWGQLVAHLRFAATATALLKPSSDEAEEHPSSSALATTPKPAAANSPAAVHVLYETVVALLAAADDAADAESSLWHNSDVCSAALDFVASYDMHATDAHAISPRVARILAHYAASEQPLESRLAVVKALHIARPFLRRSVISSSTTTPNCPASAVELLVVLLRLLVDDTSNIREAASTICSHCLWGSEDAPRDQVSCLLAVVRLLHQLQVAGQLQSAATMKAIMSVMEDISNDVAAKDDEANEEEKDGDDDDSEEDVLFQKEAANMFAEETVLLCLCGYIFGNDSSENVAAACRSFSVFDSLLW